MSVEESQCNALDSILKYLFNLIETKFFSYKINKQKLNVIILEKL